VFTIHRNAHAELGSAFLCADLSLTPEPRADHASYIENWLHALQNDKRAIFTAAAHAERATAFLHGLQPTTDAAAVPEVAGSKAAAYDRRSEQAHADASRIARPPEPIRASVD
jgi:antirestriction protein ArdC